jgi:hypothetical protein
MGQGVLDLAPLSISYRGNLSLERLLSRIDW